MPRALYAPTIVQGAASLVVPHLASTPAVYAPVIDRQNFYPDVVRATSGLVSYYRMNEASGSFVDDQGVANFSASGVTYHEAGATTDSDYAVKFGGSAPGGTRASTSIPTGSSPRSVEFFYKKAGGTGTKSTVYSYGSTNTRESFAVAIIDTGGGNANVELWSWAADPTVSVTGLNDGNWHHVVVTYASGASSAKVYKDGSFIGSGSYGGSLNTVIGNAPTISGNHFSPFAFSLSGNWLDELALYNVELSGATITAHYAAR